MKNIDILDIIIQSDINYNVLPQSICKNNNIISIYIYCNGHIILLNLIPLLTANQKEFHINKWNLNTDNTILYNVISNSCQIFSNESLINIKNYIQGLIHFYENRNNKKNCMVLF